MIAIKVQSFFRLQKRTTYVFLLWTTYVNLALFYFKFGWVGFDIKLQFLILFDFSERTAAWSYTDVQFCILYRIFELSRLERRDVHVYVSWMLNSSTIEEIIEV